MAPVASPDTASVSLTVIGKLGDAKYHRCKRCAQYLESKVQGVTVALQPTLPIDFEALLQQHLSGTQLKVKDNVLILCGSDIIGGESAFLTWLKEEYGSEYGDTTNSLIYQRQAKQAMRAYMDETGRSYASFSIGYSETDVIGTVMLELYTDEAPKTCAHFLRFVDQKNEHNYAGCPIHRVVPGAWVQTGDITTGRGNGPPPGGVTLLDETFSIKHDTPGIISMAGLQGKPHANGSQFFITLEKLPWLDGKRVAFGRVIDGMRTLRLLAKLDAQNERPLRTVSILSCSEWFP